MKFLNKQFTQETLKLALPVMLTQVGQVSVNLFDNIIVGKLLGAKALAAVSLGNAMFFSIFIFGLGFSLAIPPLVSEAHSQHNHNRIGRVAGYEVDSKTGYWDISVELSQKMGQLNKVYVVRNLKKLEVKQIQDTLDATINNDQ